MALQTLPNKIGVPLGIFYESSLAQVQLNAAGESAGGVGQVILEGGSGSKTISSAGGKIYWSAFSATFANAGTNLRVGIQDLSSGLDDGTFDVYADLVGGTDTIQTSTLNATAMETGTKTINHGDIVAIVIEMTAFGGADSVIVRKTSTSTDSNFPYSTQDTGTLGRSGNLPLFTIEFNDGTLGWFFGTYACISTTVAYNTGSTPDERALLFSLPFSASIAGAQINMGSIASTDNFEIILYSDPLGTPVAERTFVVDPNNTGSTSSVAPYSIVFSSSYTASINTNYAIAVRPTTANSISLAYSDFGSGNSNLRKPTALGTSWSMASRSEQTGAFSSTDTQIPQISLVIDKLDDGTGAGGGSKYIIGG